MGRRIAWLLSPLLVAGGWVTAHWLTYELPMHHTAHDVLGGPAPMCAATAMMVLLLLLVGVRPAIVLGRRLTIGRAPRAFAWATPAAPAWLAPELARPPILATGHGERAPPFAVSSA